MQDLKKEKYDMKVKACNVQKEIDSNNREVKWSKKNLQFAREECSKYNKRVKELEANLEAMRGCIDELKDELKLESEKNSCKEKETLGLQQKLQTLQEIEKVMQSKEKDWEVNVKEADKSRSKVSNLENSLNLKRLCVDALEKKLAMGGNDEMQSWFKYEGKNQSDQSEEYHILRETRRKKHSIDY